MLSREALANERIVSAESLENTLIPQGNTREPLPRVYQDAAELYRDAELRELSKAIRESGLPEIPPHFAFMPQIMAMRTVIQEFYIGETLADALAQLGSDEERKDALEAGYSAGSGVWKTYKAALVTHTGSLSQHILFSIQGRIAVFDNALYDLRHSPIVSFTQNSQESSQI